MRDLRCIDFHRFARLVRPAKLLIEHIVLVERRRSLGNDVARFLVGGHVFDLIRDHSLFDNAVRRFDKAELVDLRIG